MHMRAKRNWIIVMVFVIIIFLTVMVYYSRDDSQTLGIKDGVEKEISTDTDKVVASGTDENTDTSPIDASLKNEVKVSDKEISKKETLSKDNSDTRTEIDKMIRENPYIREIASKVTDLSNQKNREDTALTIKIGKEEMEPNEAIQRIVGEVYGDGKKIGLADQIKTTREEVRSARRLLDEDLKENAKARSQLIDFLRQKYGLQK